MARLPTASGLTRALACPVSCVLPHTEAASSRHASVGREVHGFMERLAKGRSWSEAMHGLSEEAHRFCSGIEPEALPIAIDDAWLSERAYAYDLASGRGYALDVADRAYPQQPGTLYGTADLARVAGATLVVIDIKTGRGWLPSPAESGQLRFLALAAADAHGCTDASVGHLMLRDDGSAWLDLEHLDALELDSVRLQLQALAAQVKALESGTAPRVPREGPWCRYCPAFVACPAKAALACATVHALGELTPEVAAAAWQRIKDVRSVLDRTEASIREYAAQQPIPLPDGMELALAETSRESIDGAAAEPVVRGLLGDAADEAFSVATTKGQLEDAAAAWVAAEKAAGRKATKKAAVESLLAALREAGAITTTRKSEVRERRARP